MSNLTDQEKKFIKALQNDDDRAVIRILPELKEKGTSEVLKAVLERFVSTESAGLQDAIFRILIDLKVSTATPLIMEQIAKLKGDKLAAMVGVCWQSSFDFSPYFNVFVDVFLQNELLVSIEAATVIENFESDIDSEVAKIAIDKLKTNLSNLDEQQKALASDLIHTLEHRI